MNKYRYLYQHVAQDLAEKMVFVGGPRQVGKTTFAFSLLQNGNKSHPAYFNWDIQSRRKEILAERFPKEESIIVLDEIHKYARWRNLLKGLFDQYVPKQNFLVTGSARLDYYRKGGDSLQGRYHYYRMHPFSLCELSNTPTSSDAQHLMQCGGFPEPCIRGQERFLRRWQRERISRVIYEDLRDLERVKEISLIELLVDALPERVGSPLSIASLREDLEVAHQTAETWVKMLENLYMTFRIAPFGAPKLRAVKKEQKLYFWDWTQVQGSGPRFENLVACQLLKFCHWREDTEGYRMELRFIRDTDKREVDFVCLQNKKPLFAVECKSGERDLSPAIKYFSERTSIPEFFQVHMGSKHYARPRERAQVIPIEKFCIAMGMP